MRDYNCRGCHQLGESGGAIRKVIEASSRSRAATCCRPRRLSPPMLYNATSKIGEGSRVHTDWLHGFLQRSRRNEVRPWLDLRMPTFEFTEEQLNTLTRYFAALDKVPYPVRAAATASDPR